MNDGYVQIGVIGMRDPATGKFMDESIPIYIQGQANTVTEARAEKQLCDMILERLCQDGGLTIRQAEEAAP